MRLAEIIAGIVLRSSMRRSMSKLEQDSYKKTYRTDINTPKIFRPDGLSFGGIPYDLIQMSVKDSKSKRV
ncbi:hypothetical protein D3C78_1794780 [compost metagenome]